MRKILCLISTLVLCICMVAAAPSAFAADTQRALLVDSADLLTEREQLQLQNKLEQISRTYDTEIVIITVDDMGGMSADDFVEYLYDSLNYGYGSSRDGVMLMVSMAERDYRILSNGRAAKAIDDDAIENIGDKIVDDLGDGDYARAFDKFADRCAYYLDGYINGFPFPVARNLLIALVIGAVVGLIVVLILRGQLKTVKKKYLASDYVKAGSMKVTAAYDMYLYRNVTRRAKPQDSSGSGSRSGSSRHVGGGKF